MNILQERKAEFLVNQSQWNREMEFKMLGIIQWFRDNAATILEVCPNHVVLEVCEFVAYGESHPHDRETFLALQEMRRKIEPDLRVLGRDIDSR